MTTTEQHPGDNDQHDSLWTTDAVCRALLMSERRFRSLRNGAEPDYLIPPSYAAGTNQAAWSRADVIRLYAVALTRSAHGPEERKRVFDAITPEHVHEALRRDLYVVDTFGRTFVTEDVVGAVRRCGAASATIVDLSLAGRDVCARLADKGIPLVREN